MDNPTEADERIEVLEGACGALAYALDQACELLNTMELTDKQGMLIAVYQQQAADARALLPQLQAEAADETTEEQRQRYSERHVQRRSRREDDKLRAMAGLDPEWGADG